jgi:hypothetical protein
MAHAVVENLRRHPTDEHLVMTTRRQFGYWFRDKVTEIAPDLRIDLSFSESILETWAVREPFLLFSLLVDPDAPTWRAWLGYRDSPTGKDYKSPRRNSDAYLRFLHSTGDSVTEEDIEQLVAQPRIAKRGEGGSALWDRAQRFLNLKERLFSEDVTDAALIGDIFSAERWISEEYLEPETARIDLDLLRSTALSILRESEERNRRVSVADHLRRIARRLRYAVGTREEFIEEAPCDVKVTTLWGAKRLRVAQYMRS